MNEIFSTTVVAVELLFPSSLVSLDTADTEILFITPKKSDGGFK